MIARDAGSVADPDVSDFRCVTAADVDRPSAAAALDRVFDDYLIAISFSEPAYALHVLANDIVAAASPIWYDREGNVVAAAVLGARGARGWLGGFGIAPQHRGRGLASALLRDVLARASALGIDSMSLEVLDGNVPALRTYETAGFTRTRRLLTFEIEAASLRSARADAPYGDGSAFLDLPDAIQPCWQRNMTSLRTRATFHAVGHARAFCVFLHDGERAQIVKAATPSVEHLAVLCASIARQTGVRHIELFSEPEHSSVARAARTLGWTVTYEADEMELPFLTRR